MKISQIIRLLKKHTPTQHSDLFGILPLKKIGAGSYRKTYRIVNAPFVIKFPHLGKGGSDTAGQEDCIKHAALEAAKHSHFMGFHELRDCLPKLYFHDKRTGVIVMEYIDEDKAHSSEWRKTERMGDLIGVLIKSLTRKKLTDISDNNLKLAKGGQLKFIDLAF